MSASASAGRSRGARRATSTLWMAAACVLALAAWLLLPRARGTAPARAPLRAVLVDVSASVARASTWLPWARAELRRVALAAREAGEELMVVSYADGVATGFAPGAPESFLERLEGRAGAPFDPGLGLGRGGTDLAAALSAVSAELTAGGRPAGALVLLAPAVFTGKSPAALLSRLSEVGVSVETSGPPRPEASDLGLVALELPVRVEAGARLVARARLVLRRGRVPPGEAAIELEVERGEERAALVQAMLLPAGDGEFELPLDLGAAGPGLNRVEARVRLGSGPDLMPENDRAGAETLAGGARAIGVLCTAELEPVARAWLAPGGRSALAGLQFRFLAPEELGPALEDLSAVVTFDSPSRRLHGSLLASFVRRGGGWLATSGWSFLEDWIPGEPGGELERLLPCEPAGEGGAERDVVVLVDGSGSMEGAPFESVRSAALELVSSALPGDRVRLQFFTRGLEREHLLKPASAARVEDAEAARRVARELLALRVPAGTTFLLSSLEELARELGQRDALVLLLTDGQEREGLADPPERARAVAAELARRRARLAVIAVGDADRALLAALAGGDERVYDGRSLSELRAIFLRELHAPRVAEGELVPRWAPAASGSLADEVASVAGARAELAPLTRHLRNRLRPGAEALWESEQGEPVLALARAGLGRTALFASNPGPGWAGRSAAREFEGLLRWLARGPERPSTPRARLEGERLAVSGLDPSAPPVLGARLFDLAGPGREELVLVAAPGLPEAVLRTREARPTVLEWTRPALELDPIGAEPALVLAVERGPREEFAWRERPLDLTGQGSGPGRAALPGDMRRSHPAAGWVLAFGLALLFAAGLATLGGQGERDSGR